MPSQVIHFRVALLLALMVLLALTLTAAQIFGHPSLPWSCGAWGLATGFWLRKKLDNENAYFQSYQKTMGMVLAFIGFLCGRVLQALYLSQFALASIYGLFIACAFGGLWIGMWFGPRIPAWRAKLGQK